MASRLYPGAAARPPMTAIVRPFARAIAVLSLLAGCDRPMPLDVPAAARPSTPVAIGAAQAVVSHRPRRPTAELVASYLRSADAAKRREALYDLHLAPADEGVPAIDRLLITETDPDLLTELLDSLAVFDGEVEAKLRALGGALFEHPVHGDVREAALDALLDLQDRRAITLWQRLLADPIDDVRDLARNTINELQALGATGAAESPSPDREPPTGNPE